MTGPAPLAPTTPRRQAIRHIADRLAAAGIEDAQREARALAVAILGLAPVDLVLAPDAPLGDAASALDAAAARRATREPFHRITGAREFHGLDFVLSAETLIPRPDTETLVEALLDAIARQGRTAAPLTILDLGTGTGAILIALIAHLPRATGIGTDLSADALTTAAANADRLIGHQRVSFVRSDWFAAVAGRYDVIVSNPPYIASADIAGLEPEVARHDPTRALDGGADGLDAYRAIAAGAGAHLAEGGMIGLELGAGQREPVTALFAAHGFAVTGCQRDLGGIERALLLARA